MKVLEANITDKVSTFFHQKLKETASYVSINEEIWRVCGIHNFFAISEELQVLKETITGTLSVAGEPDRTEYGDFQTNVDLAGKITLSLASKNISPETIIEPTCGKGNFIIASLKNFKSVKNILGIEIYKPYVWETKFSILDFYLENPEFHKPEIQIIHGNVFDFDFKKIAKEYSTSRMLIIGNPPWVTSSSLGSLNSSNVPKKTNFKNHNGLDAMTGKGNFDIGEFITLKMIETFQRINGNVALLVKNSVIKNIVFEQKKNEYKIAFLEKQSIDCKKEFNVSVEASLFSCKMNSIPEFYCNEFSFYENKSSHQKFGWFENKFVSNIDTYIHTKEIDGESPFEWRQGLKHDCSSIMELDKVNGHYVNGLNEQVKLEEELVYGILKSSDLKNTVIEQTRKFTIVTQKKVGQDTNYIKSKFPQTYQYLIEHKTNFDARKSSIYNDKPLFSIFGIGAYSFKPFKVAISGLYKTFHFTLILPQSYKPVMLDDTCYFLGFDSIEFAVYALILLNSETTKQFLNSITFSDAKRVFTKDILMRIDLLKLATIITNTDLQFDLAQLNKKYNFNLTLNLWKEFLRAMNPELQPKLVFEY